MVWPGSERKREKVQVRKPSSGTIQSFDTRSSGSSNQPLTPPNTAPSDTGDSTVIIEDYNPPGDYSTQAQFLPPSGRKSVPTYSHPGANFDPTTRVADSSTFRNPWDDRNSGHSLWSDPRSSAGPYNPYIEAVIPSSSNRSNLVSPHQYANTVGYDAGQRSFAANTQLPRRNTEHPQQTTLPLASVWRSNSFQDSSTTYGEASQPPAAVPAQYISGYTCPAQALRPPLTATKWYESHSIHGSDAVHEDDSHGEDDPVPSTANHGYQCEVTVWQDGFLASPPRLSYIPLKFDTQCEGANWVARNIVEDLGANTTRLPCVETFCGFNGQPMEAGEEVNLSFRNTKGGSIRRARFFIAPRNNMFEMVLGQDDLISFDILPRPQLGLTRDKKKLKAERQEEPARVASHNAEVEERERRRKKHESKSRQSSAQSSRQNTGSNFRPPRW